MTPPKSIMTTMTVRPEEGEAKPGWPPGRVPIELFSMIIEYLPKHSALKRLRLVNREFHEKTQIEFFQNTVINVGLKFNDSSDSGNYHVDGSTAPGDITEFIMSHNMFQRAAPFVHRLAFALEISEQELASPEVDEEDEIEVCPWGVYRWPVDRESRSCNLRLDNITKSLERTRGISHILGQATNIQELALSCGGGLGYLQGPDVSVHMPPGPQPIFGNPHPVRAAADRSLPSLRVEFRKPYKQEKMEKRLAGKGVTRWGIAWIMNQLIKADRTNKLPFTHENRTRAALPVSRYGEQRITRPAPLQPSNYRLQPDLLTDTQVRLLFEHVTAQQALVQAFVLGAIKHGDSFEYLTKLNIARLSSFHVHQLCVEEFWSALPQLEEVSLAIEPEWRSVAVEDKYTVDVRQVYPTDALPKVFTLLNDHIGRQPHIKRVHFEWLCGGEMAAGWLQRNSYVLPAPFLKKHRLVICSGEDNLLILPHVTHLSLKNCWFAPNVLYRIIHTMAKKHSLVSLELESVSLTGPPLFRQVASDPNQGMPDVDPAYQPWPLPLDAAQGQKLPGLIQNPLPLSWSHIIDMLTPGPTIKERVYAEENPYGPQLRIRKELNLRKLVFKSCGYIEIPDSRFVSNRRFWGLFYPHQLNQAVYLTALRYREKRRLFVDFMQVNTDRHLGRISELSDPREQHCMMMVFGLRTLWEYGITHFRAAMRDGVAVPGIGRFSGTIDADSFMRVDSDDKAQAYEFDTGLFDHDYQNEDEDGLDAMLKRFEVEMGYQFPRPDSNDNGNANANAN
ncbi:hypothetical protein F5Y00DRAFT_273145 [Daldinia vernicosa]|uniref:uncharacterized protein n=1 Tax=Daldinia vernicosa TaxID=114800 RepID=UPI0020086261|nr:uncharacterized protein F5Y00DRAFT_273145 [Daldinia vernicosa]KAI0852552.1 hypothetical protein F5Y00DRAFT_273145 [Daldinia vernicosa]